MPAQSPQNEQPDSPMEMETQEHRERKGARPSETSPSEISERPVVKARAASPETIVATLELFSLCSGFVQQGRDDDRRLVRDRWDRRSRDVHTRNSVVVQRTGIDCGCAL